MRLKTKTMLRREIETLLREQGRIQRERAALLQRLDLLADIVECEQEWSGRIVDAWEAFLAQRCKYETRWPCWTAFGEALACVDRAIGGVDDTAVWPAGEGAGSGHGYGYGPMSGRHG